MIVNIPPEITIASFSLIGILTGYIWNNQGKKIDKIIKIQENRPCNIICGRIEAIQTDISWIKERIKK
jgi:hypothetical protein